MVAILRELSDHGMIQLIVPQIILDEFERNRNRVQEAMTRSVSARFREVRKAIDEHGRGDGRQKALDELDNITHQAPLVNELATQTFDAILDLLHLGKAITPAPEMKQRVVERALAKRAPFHREKNSVADALLIEMYGNAAKIVTDSDRCCFITHNTKDFSATEGDMRHPFEWGMLNGKMSAIRWMLGEDWESTLDT